MEQVDHDEISLRKEVSPSTFRYNIDGIERQITYEKRMGEPITLATYKQEGRPLRIEDPIGEDIIKNESVGLVELGKYVQTAKSLEPKDDIELDISPPGTELGPIALRDSQLYELHKESSGVIWAKYRFYMRPTAGDNVFFGRSIEGKTGKEIEGVFRVVWLPGKGPVVEQPLEGRSLEKELIKAADVLSDSEKMQELHRPIDEAYQHVAQQKLIPFPQVEEKKEIPAA